LARTWKETVMVSFQALTQHLLGGTKKMKACQTLYQDLDPDLLH